MRKFNMIQQNSGWRLWSVLGMAVLAGTAAGQTTTPVAATTTSGPPTVASFNIERVLPLNAYLSSFTPTFPAHVSAGVKSGALEIRESIVYNTANQLLTLNQFTVQAGAPLPTTSLLPSSIFSILTIKVANVYSSLTPTPSLMFDGTVATNSPASPFGNVTGAPAAVSIGYTTDTPPKINNVVTLIAGTVVEYSPSGAGTVTFSGSPVVPPGSGGGPAIVLAPIANPTTLRVVTLDASGSTSPNAPLTYSWSVVTGAADIGNPTSAVATGYILGGAGSYTFMVTVTDTKGNVSTQSVTVQFQL
jgi:hypothetical protein